MNGKTCIRFLLPALMIFSVLLAAVCTTPVQAQGEEPPSGDAPETEPQATSEPSEGEPAGEEPGADPPPADSPPADNAATAPPSVDPPPAADAPDEAQTSLLTEDSPVLSQAVEALDETGLVLVDDQGQALPLASQEAAQILNAADPYFYHTSCAGGKCTYGSFAETLTNFASKNANGYIYVEGGVSYGETVNIDAALVAGYAGLQGLAWRKADSAAPPILEPQPIINGDVTIQNFAHAFSLEGLRINGGLTLNHITGNVSLNDVTVNGGSGIDLTNNTGSANLTDVTSTNATDNGISIVNQNGAINLTEVKLTYAADNGLSIVSHTGAVNLAVVSANHNHSYGADIDTSGAVKIAASAFDNNGADGIADDGGLRISRSGTISMTGVSASENLGSGAYFVKISSGLTIRNSIFDNNTDAIVGQSYGIAAFNLDNKGNLTFENVLANHNQANNWLLATNGNVALKTVEGNESQSGNGLYLQTLGNGTLSLSDSSFNNNLNGYGLFAMSAGAVTLDTTLAVNNGLGGAYLNTLATPGKTVNVSNSQFGNNQGGHGLEIAGRGAITLDNVDAWDNAAYGLSLDNTQGTAGVSLLNTSGDNNIDSNRMGGVSIRSKGALILNGVDSSTNQDYGANLDNCLWNGTICTGTGAVTITQSAFNRTWHDNGDPTAPGYPQNPASLDMAGLLVRSKGLITLNNVSVSESYNNSDPSSGIVGVSGAQLYNNFNGATAGVSILSALGNNRFDWNQGGSGLFIHSNGAVSLSNLSASHNQDYGIMIQNDAGTGGVSLLSTANRWNVLEENGISGLLINSRGAVSLSRVSASRNGGDGVRIENHTGNAGVTIQGGNLNENTSDGLYVSSRGAANLTDIQANSNTGTGAALLGVSSVTLATTADHENNFNANQEHGLSISSKGNVTINNLNAAENHIIGVTINTCNNMGAGCATKGNVTFTNTPGRWSWAGGNDVAGIDINAGGNISMERMNASGNVTHNAYLVTHGTGGVSIQQGQFNAGGFYGLFINAAGAITLNGISADENLAGGGNLQSQGNIAVSSSNFNRNTGDGLYALAGGTLALNQVTVEENQRGAMLDVHGNVQIDASSFNGNKREFGLFVLNGGTITLSDVESNANGTLVGNDPTNPASAWAYGVRIYQSSSAAPKNITINRSQFNNNYGYGLDVYVPGNILVDGIAANNNFSYHMEGASSTYHYGAWLQTSASITLSDKFGRSQFNDNAHYGINAISGGKMTLTGASANNNQKYGFYLFSDGDAALSRLYGYSNDGGGLLFTGSGAVKLDKAEFVENNAFGAFLRNTAAAAPRSVTVSNGQFNGTPDGSGLVVFSNGAITLNTVSACNNRFDSGALLTNTTGTAGVTVTAAKGYNEFSGNRFNGLSIATHGAVNLSNLRASRNNESGVVAYGATTITINNLMAIQNEAHGVNLESSGLMTLNKLYSFENGRDGVPANDSGYGLKVTSSGNVILRNSALSGNGESGVWAGLGSGYLDFYATSWLGNNRDGGLLDVFVFSGTWRVFTLPAP